MSRDTADKRVKAYVLRRTNYGEADRILNLITPDGKISAIAKGVRKSRSKLAGGVEMFSLVEVNLHQGRGDLMTVTGSKMLEFYGNLIKDYNLLELSTSMLKKINLVAESSDAPEYFGIIDSALKNLNDGVLPNLVQAWFLLNLLKASGEEVNLYRDAAGDKLNADLRYDYNAMEGAFTVSIGGEFGAAEIKILRLILTTDLLVVAKVKDVDEYAPKMLKFARIVSREM